MPRRDQGRRNTDLIVSTAAGMRSFGQLRIAESPMVLPIGTPVNGFGYAAGIAPEVIGLTTTECDTRRGPIDATIIARDAEVSDAALSFHYSFSQPTIDAIVARLRDLGIIVRPAVWPPLVWTPPIGPAGIALPPDAAAGALVPSAGAPPPAHRADMRLRIAWWVFGVSLGVRRRR
jgi:hypothetical protein